MREQLPQQKRRGKRPGSIVMMLGGGLILLDLLFFLCAVIYNSMHTNSTTYGVAEGAGMMTAYLLVFIVFPLVAFGVILVIIGLVINIIQSSVSRRKQNG